MLESEKPVENDSSASLQTSTRGHSIEKPMEEHERPKPATAADDPELGDLERHLSRKSSKKNAMAPEIYPVMDEEKGLVGWESQDDPLNPRSVLRVSWDHKC
jgi:hypothetical protein